MDKARILQEIKRTANNNGGQPLGVARFEAETGIAQSDWHGKYWARWGDALIEAGYSPNVMRSAYDDTWVIEQLIKFIRELGRFPVKAELQIKTRNDREFPSVGVFRRLGKKAELASKVVEYCEERNGYEDILAICQSLVQPRELVTQQETKDEFEIGFVYLMKSGKYYKIGHTNAVGRREYELAIKLPEEIVTVHAIKTDDPVGIEAYWHNRFAKKRLKGEWFDLNSADIKAFKRRKFM